jgi:hypothetical protein
MSFRDDLAAAISAVDGVGKCTAYHRQTTTPGEAMIRLDRRVRDDSGFGYLNTWQVVVILPQNLATAEKWIDTHGDALMDAARAHMVVLSLTPGQLPVDTSLVPCVVLEGVREN